jgi:hypothetical protein
MSGHLDSKPVSDVIVFNRLSGSLCSYLFHGQWQSAMIFSRLQTFEDEVHAAMPYWPSRQA